MTDDHTLVVLDDPPLVGRGANQDAWHGYFSSFPDYVIHPRHIECSGTSIAVLGDPERGAVASFASVRTHA